MPNPAQNIAAAISAYSKAVKGEPSGIEPRDGAPAGEFAELVKGALKTAVETNRAAEAISMAAINDRADLSQVVTAVAEAEVTLQTVIAVRDKVIEAYKEILRMPM